MFLAKNDVNISKLKAINLKKNIGFWPKRIFFGPKMPKQNLPNTSKHYDNVTWRRYVTFEKCFSTETLFTEFGSHKLWSALRNFFSGSAVDPPWMHPPLTYRYAIFKEYF